MRVFTWIIALAAVVFVGCKSGEGSESYDFTPIDKTSSIPTGDNSRTSLDWAGVYEGTTPCADCEGIKTTLRLNNDETFVLSQTYLGKDDKASFKNEGNFVWDENGSDVIVAADGITIRFKVGENEVTMLDMEGNVVSGALANFYVLKKVN